MPSNSWANGWVTGDIPTAAEFAKGMGAISDTTLGVAQATIDVSGLPTTYAHLMLVIQGRGDPAASTVNALLRLNNDSGANQYTYGVLNSTGSTASATDNASATSFLAGVIAAGTAAANLSGSALVWLPHYNSTTFIKRVQAYYSTQWGTGSGNLNHGLINGFWNSTAAVNRVTLLASSGSFVAGTRLTIYALGA